MRTPRNWFQVGFFVQKMNKKYYNQDFEQYVSTPRANAEKSQFYKGLGMSSGPDCITVGINTTFMPTDKNDPTNLDKAQFNIKDRFGYLSEDDTISDGENLE